MDVGGATSENYTGAFTGSAIQIDVEAGIRLRGGRDVTFRNFDVTSARPLRFVGNGLSPMERIVFENVKVNGKPEKDGEVAFVQAGK